MKTVVRSAAVCLLLVISGVAQAQTLAVDVERSTVTVHAFKSGLLSAFAHDHMVQAPVERGEVRLSGDKGVELLVDSRRMKVLDPKLEPDKRAEVQQTMHSAKVLDSANYPQIRFRSRAVEQTGAGRWLVRGDLSLHGRTRPVVVEVNQDKGIFRGKARFKQREFGITPVSIGGGTIKVKDELLIEFVIHTRPAAETLTSSTSIP
jgi:polyisoprenoid-binding protein YceI